jgi:hypothetical protein
VPLSYVLDSKKKRVRDDMAYLRSNKLSLLKSGVYTPETYVDEEQKLDTELSSFQMNEQASDLAMKELMAEVTILSELLKDVVPVYDFANPQ